MGLALLVRIKSAGNLNNKIFMVACVAIIFWAAANYFSNHSILLGNLVWIRLVMFFAVFLQFIFFMFVYLFPQNKIIMAKWKFYFLMFFALMTMIATLSPFVFTKLEIRDGTIMPITGPLMPLFASAIFLFLGLSIYSIIRKYRVASGDEKIQWRFILSGFSMMFLLLIISQFLLVVLFQITDFIKYGPIFTLPFIVLSAYAIIKHNLLNVKIIATELIVGVILLVSLIDVLMATTLPEILWTSLFLFVMSVLGLLLIKSVLKEVQTKLQIRELADNLKNANEELKKLDKTKSEFLSIASHQLRTPLTAIQGYTSMLLEGTFGRLPEATKQPINNILSSSQRLLKLINNLLNISRIESGRTEIDRQKISLENLISSIVQELSIEAQPKKIKLEWIKPPNPLPELFLDQEKIRQVILNIIDNAIRYTNQGGVKIEAAEKNGAVYLSIKDTGEGMTTEDLQQMFSSFRRGQAGSRFWTEGTGLGLYVAKKFIELHGGEIRAESSGKGKGSTFHIKIPINYEKNLNQRNN